jgi:hypothetical protein
VIVNADERASRRSFEFLCIASTIVFAFSTIFPLCARYYLSWQYGVATKEVQFSDYAASLNVAVMFVLIGFSSYPIFKVLRMRQLTLPTIWHHYSYLAGSFGIVLIFLLMGMVLIYWAAIFVALRVLRLDDLELYKLFDLTFGFGVLCLWLITLGITIYTYATSLHQTWKVPRAKVVIGALASYVVAMTFLYLIVSAVDRHTGLNLYEISGLSGPEALLRSIQKVMESTP